MKQNKANWANRNDRRPAYTATLDEGFVEKYLPVSQLRHMTEDNARDLQRTWVCDGCGSATVVGLRRSWVCIGRGSEVVVDMHRSLACDGRGSATVVGLHRSWVFIERGSASVTGLRRSWVYIGRGSMRGCYTGYKAEGSRCTSGPNQ